MPHGRERSLAKRTVATEKQSIRFTCVYASAADAERLKVGIAELEDGADAERIGVEVQEDEVLNPDELNQLLKSIPPTRFERVTPGLGILCSIHLSYGGAAGIQ